MTRATVVLGLVLANASAMQGAGVPRGRAKLLAWLKAGTYRQTFTPEPTIRASQTVHTANVRSWYSPELVQALRDGTVPFPKNAAMVKELYGGDTEGIDGYSVMVKVRRRSGAAGEGWFWYETLDGKTPIAIGRGVRLCSGCHQQGTDFLQSTFRP
jgi:hypothetical protein